MRILHAPRERGNASESLYGEFVKPRLVELLRAVGLDVTYHRAEGDYLWFRDARGNEIRVLDLLGGYGAALFGHHEPELVRCLQRQLSSGRPFHAQASVRELAGMLGARLSEMVGRATGRSYVATFASSGAEAVEAALKHAELEAWQRRQRELDGMRRRVSRARERYGVDAFAEGELRPVPENPAVLAAKLAELIARAQGELTRPPAVLALEGAFHGKTSGALRLTHNPRFREPWERWGQAVFLPLDDLAALEEAVARNTSTFSALEEDDGGKLRLVSKRFVNVLAIVCEPIQGEGGVRELDPSYFAALRRMADEHGIPLVIDEIQSGMGRTGRFLASEWAGVRGDYYLLSKSLGGGLTKIAALLVDRQRYVHDFGYLHTSTFAEDDHSAAVALAALDLVERDGGALLTRCREKGDHLLRALRGLAAEFPDRIEAVRGRGLLIGVALKPATGWASVLLSALSEQRLTSYFLAGYLLRRHAIRVAPTLSEHETLRIEPSAAISTEELDRFVHALRDGLTLLREGNVARLAGLSGLQSPPHGAAQRPRKPAARLVTRRRVGFLAHLRDERDLRLVEPSLGALPDDQCRELMTRVDRVLAPFLLGRESVRSALGSAVELHVIAVPFTAKQALAALREGDTAHVLALVQSAVELAAELGCLVVGCGGYTSIVSDNCRDLITDGIGVTSGNSLTAAATADALLAAAARRGVRPGVLGVVGATGNIGAMLGELVAEHAERVVLVGRPGARSRLERVASRLGGHVTIATQLEALRECSLIVTATNSAVPILFPEHVGDHPVVICDAAVPRDVSPRVELERPHAVVVRGGSIRLPLGQELSMQGVCTGAGTVYACLAEAVLLGLADVSGSFSYGALRAENVRLVRALAKRHGFGVEESRGVAADAWRGLDG